LIKFENHSNYNCEIVLDTGEKYLVYANWIHNNSLDHWQGWHCEAGHKRFYIDKNFDVWSGECQNDYLGNATEEWAIKNNSTCKQSTCTGCTDDLLTAKRKHA
jgi:hypothetical protein